MTDHLFLFVRQERNGVNFDILKLTNDTAGTVTWNLINSQWPITSTQFYDGYYKAYFGFNHTSFPSIIASEDQKSVFIWSNKVFARFHDVCYSDEFFDCERLIRSGLQKKL